jgi:hypothetical protein
VVALPRVKLAEREKAMKGQLIKGWRIAAVLLGAALMSPAQNAYTSSSVATPAASQASASASQTRTTPRPGTVNYLEGQVSIDGQDLARDSAHTRTVGVGEAISTGSGYVEVLLTPGAYLRLGHNSEARMISAGLADTRVELTRGTALVEVAQLVKGSHLGVQADGATTLIESKGLYGFDTGMQSVKVLDGKAKVTAETGETTLKKGDQVLLASENPLKKRDYDSKLAKAEPLYVWSKVRSESEAASNVNLTNTLVARGGWYGPGWYWDPYLSFYSFVPGWGTWYSPFGFGYYPYGFGYAYPVRYYGVRPVYRGAIRPGFAGAHLAGGFRAGGGFHGGRR